MIAAAARQLVAGSKWITKEALAPLRLEGLVSLKFRSHGCFIMMLMPCLAILSNWFVRPVRPLIAVWSRSEESTSRRFVWCRHEAFFCFTILTARERIWRIQIQRVSVPKCYTECQNIIYSCRSVAGAARTGIEDLPDFGFPSVNVMLVVPKQCFLQRFCTSVTKDTGISRVFWFQMQKYCYSRRSAAGSARTKVIRCHMRKRVLSSLSFAFSFLLCFSLFLLSVSPSRFLYCSSSVSFSLSFLLFLLLLLFQVKYSRPITSKKHCV